MLCTGFDFLTFINCMIKSYFLFFLRKGGKFCSLLKELLDDLVFGNIVIGIYDIDIG